MSLKKFSPGSLLKMREASMRRKFIIFSVILYLVIFIGGSTAFILMMDRVLHANSGYELLRIAEYERLKLENHVNDKIALVQLMAKSPILINYFQEPENLYLQARAHEEIAVFCEALAGTSIFWVNDNDKKFYMDGELMYYVNPDDPSNYWYYMTLHNTESYNFNINYNPDLNNTNLWVNVPVFNNEKEAIGILGSGINLSSFLDAIYKDYSNIAELYFFNDNGEITGSENAYLAAEKKLLWEELGRTGGKIFDDSQNLDTDNVHIFKVEDWYGIIALGKVPVLGWYITVVLPFSLMDVLHTRLTFLFLLLMVVIAAIFVGFNLFVAGLLEPLTDLIKAMNQLSVDWDLRHHKGEIETLSTFLNLAIHDPLTGIFNRRYLDGSFKKIIKSLSRTNEKLSVLMLDIDFFKKYNDTYGHEAGDTCLKMVSHALNQCISRPDDFIVRYGGEEFVVILPNTGEEGARIIAEKLLDKMRECNIPHEKNDAASHVTISIGGTTGSVEYTQMGSEYIKRADEALYMSKQNGRNKYTFKPF
jgi:methyl-accepting chemotaxis protein